MPPHAFALPDSAFDELMPPPLSFETVRDPERDVIYVARVFRLWDMANQALGFSDRSESALYKDDYCIEDYDLDSLHIVTLLYAEQDLPADAWPQLEALGARLSQAGQFQFDPEHTGCSIGLIDLIDRNVFALLDYLEGSPADHGDLLHGLATACRQGARTNQDDVYRHRGENHYNALLAELDREARIQSIARAAVLFRKARQASASF